MKSFRTLVVILLGILAGGCDDVEHIAVQTTTRVHVRDVASGQPVAGVKVVLMGRATNTPLAAPLLSNASGVCDFPVMPTGDLAVLAYGGGWRVFGEIDSWWGKDGGGLADPLTPPAYADPLVRVAAIPAPGGAHIAGTVVDAGTGAPLASVFLSDTPYPDAYNGNIGPSDDVTLDDGAFRVSRIRFVIDPATGRVSQAVPLWVTRHGYRPRLWRYEPAPGEEIDEITGVRIELARAGDGDRGSLRGRLLRDGEPVKWVFVGLGWAELPGAKAGAGMTGWTARTDGDGVFIFADLPVGRYVLHPGFLPGDGAYFADQPANVPHEVAAGVETDAGDYLLLWELAAVDPRSGATVPAATRDFRWIPAPSAVTYDFFLDRNGPVKVVGAQHQLPPSDPLAPGNHVWYVVAYDAQNVPVGAFATAAEFHVPGPAGR